MILLLDTTKVTFTEGSKEQKTNVCALLKYLLNAVLKQYIRSCRLLLKK